MIMPLPCFFFILIKHKHVNYTNSMFYIDKKVYTYESK